ncbi:MAG: flavodoxin family protein [Bacillota bacterium]|nr:flavodoxin family protein [Bacillota bacterium]
MNKLIGISAGRKGKATESLIRAILAGTGTQYDLISLSGKLIQPCEACNGCVKTNRCIIKDDFQKVYESLQQADGFVFGAPTYWEHMNSKGQAFWERACFSGRHNALFPLKGKIAVAVGIGGYDSTGEHVLADLKRYFEDARINLLDSIVAQGEFACFNCGFGSTCPVGGFADLYPLGTPITPEITPSICNQLPNVADLPDSLRDIRGKAHGLGLLLAEKVIRRGKQ